MKFLAEKAYSTEPKGRYRIIRQAVDGEVTQWPEKVILSLDITNFAPVVTIEKAKLFDGFVVTSHKSIEVI